MKSVTLASATALVISSMIGTGVFTSLGFQLADIRSGFAIVMLWLLGGGIAICGALAYSELARTFPRSGGEYNFISRLFHPSLGFMTGVLSAIGGTVHAKRTALAYVLRRKGA